MSNTAAVSGDEVAVALVTVNVTMMCQGTPGISSHQIYQASYDPATGKTRCLKCGNDLGINPPKGALFK